MPDRGNIHTKGRRGARALQITLSGLSIRYEVFGAENTKGDLLLLHGWACYTEVYRALIQHLQDRGHRVFTFDFPGYGGSEQMKTPWNPEDYATLTQEFIAAMGREYGLAAAGLSLIGHSHGGRVIALLCGSGGFTPARVVFLDAWVIRPEPTPKQLRRQRAFRWCKRALTFPLWRRFTGGLLQKARRHYGSADYNAAPEVLRETMVRLVNRDLREYLPHIGVPALLIYGENDTATPVSDARIMEKLLPDGGLCVIPGAGHYAFADHPGRVYAILDSFLG